MAKQFKTEQEQAVGPAIADIFERSSDTTEDKIATFPTHQHGAAAMFDLLARKYTGRTVETAIKTWCGGWTCQVEQRHYGHRARKATWLYAYGLTPPPLKWGPGAKPEAWISSDRPRAELAALGIAQLGKKEAKATPPAFRELLLSMAREAHNA